MKQIPLAMALPQARSFESYLGGSNRAALEHLQQLGRPSAPTYLWGPPGCGKSHLLAALAARWQARGARVGAFDARSSLPWDYDQAWTLVLLDDCEALDAARQQAAFALLVEAATHGVPWVAAGHLPPVDLQLRDDLRTRLAWGLVFALEPLAEAEVRAVLRRAADARGIFLSDEVMDYVLTRFARDLTHLTMLLDRLDDFALAHQRSVTVPLVRLMLAEEGA
jgi:DnaA-homolog protein